MAFPLQYKKLRQTAYLWLEEHEPEHPLVQSDKTELSYHWGKNFFERHPHLNRKTPKPLSLQRAIHSSKGVVDKFFEEVARVKKEHNIPAGNIWNIDETGVDTIPVVSKVVGRKGKKSQMIVSGEKGTRTSVVVIASSGGRGHLHTHGHTQGYECAACMAHRCSSRLPC